MKEEYTRVASYYNKKYKECGWWQFYKKYSIRKKMDRELMCIIKYMK
jgi:hypothetical protein